MLENVPIKNEKQGLLKKLVDFERSLVINAIFSVKDYVVSLPSRISDWRLNRHLQALESLDPRTRWKAAEALGKLKFLYMPSVSRLEQHLLEDVDEIVRAKSAEALGVLGGHNKNLLLTDALRKALSDEDEVVRVSASEALKYIESKRLERQAARLKEDANKRAAHIAETTEAIKDVESAMSQAESQFKIIGLKIQRRKNRMENPFEPLPQAFSKLRKFDSIMERRARRNKDERESIRRVLLAKARRIPS